MSSAQGLASCAAVCREWSKIARTELIAARQEVGPADPACVPEAASRRPEALRICLCRRGTVSESDENFERKARQMADFDRVLFIASQERVEDMRLRMFLYACMVPSMERAQSKLTCKDADGSVVEIVHREIDTKTSIHESEIFYRISSVKDVEIPERPANGRNFAAANAVVQIVEALAAGGRKSIFSSFTAVYFDLYLSFELGDAPRTWRMHRAFRRLLRCQERQLPVHPTDIDVSMSRQNILKQLFVAVCGISPPDAVYIPDGTYYPPFLCREHWILRNDIVLELIEHPGHAAQNPQLQLGWDRNDVVGVDLPAQAATSRDVGGRVQALGIVL
eukprot:CAMPEP_0177578028 /NCGR_PEP_ID=MMETSP0419_2-20121207/107_1 /TAXON_ID=582737 /ORGANISM="Tetraselmis sp., Strain GSL018" /LENGTH=334 /DNA_ID=CAMNT_0019066399 /DNA_START=235 /DNA_END=1240 /DNA_ORIENTATION=+